MSARGTAGGAAPELVVLGAVTKPHGIRGEVRVHLFNPDSDLLDLQDQLWLAKDGQTPRAWPVVALRRHHGALLVTFDGVEGREAAEALRGHSVAIPRDSLPPTDEEEYYHVDLVGLRAFTEDGAEVGAVVEVIAYPSVDCLRVQGGGIEREVPLLEPYVLGIDIEAGRVTVAFLDDLDARTVPPGSAPGSEP